ncbi:hypothetical protein BRD16_01705 [Halobacteriales archaeon SW_6_65_46]|nr:MAG: hypothetical protein BRD16_01705 [Halobacteriales archaeon SW_6_65_46]
MDDEAQNTDEQDAISLDPDEYLIGEVRHIERDVGEYGSDVIHLTLTETDVSGFAGGDMAPYWAGNTVSRKVTENDVGPGDLIGLRKDAEPYTYTGQDGEESEAYDFELRVLGDDDE